MRLPLAALRCCACCWNAGASVSAADEEGVTALHAACYRGHTNAVAFLIRRGVDVNGGRPLDYAARGGFVDVAALLLRHGAAAAAVTGGGRTALEVAAHGEAIRHWQAAPGAPEAGGPAAPVAAQLDIPAAQGHLDTALLLIEHGAPFAGEPDVFAAALAPRLAGIVNDAARTRRALQALTVAAASEMARLRVERAAAARERAAAEAVRAAAVDQQAAANAARAALAAERAAWEQAKAAAAQQGGGERATKRARRRRGGGERGRLAPAGSWLRGWCCRSGQQAAAAAWYAVCMTWSLESKLCLHASPRARSRASAAGALRQPSSQSRAHSRAASPRGTPLDLQAARGTCTHGHRNATSGLLSLSLLSRAADARKCRSQALLAALPRPPRRQMRP